MPIGPLAERSLSPSKGESPPAAKSAPATSASVSPFVNVMRALGHEAERGERMVRGILQAKVSGQALGPTELLALQAGIYRYGETVDLAAKLVDKIGTDVKTVVQGQP